MNTKEQRDAAYRTELEAQVAAHRCAICNIPVEDEVVCDDCRALLDMDPDLAEFLGLERGGKCYHEKG